MNIQFNIILIIIGISLGCGKKSDEKSSPPPTSSNTPSSPDSQTTENNGVTDPSYIKSRHLSVKHKIKRKTNNVI